MRFLNSTRDPQEREDSAFAERLRAIANRGKGLTEAQPVAEFAPIIPAVEQRIWNPNDLPDYGEQPAAA
jgi:hypothetical protein